MIEGTWKLIGGEQDGQQVTEAELQNSSLLIEGNQHTVTVGDVVMVGTHTVDANQNPATIDTTDTEGPFAGQSLLGICKVEEDEFTVCFAPPGAERPREFSTAGGQAAILHQWRRQG